MRWWQHKRPRPAGTLTPETVLEALPKTADSLIVRLGPSCATQPYYWQLRRDGQERDLALTAVALPGRDAPIPLTAEEVLGFAEEASAEDVVPMALLVVAKRDIDPGILVRLTHGTKTRGPQVFVIMPVGVLYDFLANTTTDGAHLTPTVGELLDGWPMRQAATLAAYVLDATVAPRLLAVPLPAKTVTLSSLADADPAVMARFSASMRHVAATKNSGTFVFTDLQ